VPYIQYVGARYAHGAQFLESAKAVQEAGNLTDAESHYLTARDDYTRWLIPDSPNVIKVDKNLGKVYSEQRKTDCPSQNTSEYGRI
jgi:hypothetical protein